MRRARSFTCGLDSLCRRLLSRILLESRSCRIPHLLHNVLLYAVEDARERLVEKRHFGHPSLDPLPAVASKTSVSLLELVKMQLLFVSVAAKRP